MTTSTKPRSTHSATRQQPRVTTKQETFPKMTPWGKEVLKRIEALHKALDGKKLA